MTKRSHQIASRQAAISRERKKKKKSQTAEKHAESFVTPDAVNVTANPESPNTSAVSMSLQSASVKSSQSTRPDDDRYQYVGKDLRQIAIIATPLIIILIILAFVL